MKLLSARTRRTIRESAQTFCIALVVFLLAIILTFVEDWCVKLNRPQWLITGIKVFSVMMFVGDGLVMLAIGVRIVVRAIRETLDEMREDE